MRTVFALLSALSFSPMLGCDPQDGPDDGAEGGSSGDAGSEEDSGAGDSSGGGDTGEGVDTAGGVALGELRASGTLGGEPFTVHCVELQAALYTGDSTWDYMCQATDARQTFTGPVNQVNVMLKGVEAGQTYTWAQGSSPLSGGYLSFAGLDWTTWATTKGPDCEGTLAVESADESSFAGSFSGTWTQDGTPVVYEVEFNLAVNPF